MAHMENSLYDHFLVSWGRQVHTRMRARSDQRLVFSGMDEVDAISVMTVEVEQEMLLETFYLTLLTLEAFTLLEAQMFLMESYLKLLPT